MADYIAVLRKQKKSDWGVSFPDAPGCFAAGATEAEAMRNATEALQLWIDAMAEAGEDIPEPDTAANIDTDPHARDEVVRLALINAELPGKAVPVTITMNERILRKIEKVAGPRGRSRFLSDAAEEKLARL